MPNDNRTLIEKADLALSDLQGGNGYLAEQQASEFIRLAIKESTLLPQVTFTPMRGPVEERSKIRFGGRVLKPGNSATSLPASQRSAPDLSSYQLNAKLYKAQVNIDDETLEDQIERDSFTGTIMEELSKAISRDVEFLAVNGDTASADPLLATMDGWLKQVTSNITDFSSVSLNKDGLRDMHKTMPEEFASVERMKFYTSRDARIDYRDSLSNRQTAYGDAVLVSQDTTMYQDMPIESVPEWPNDPTSVLLTDPKNLTVGFHRNIRFEMDRDVAGGVNLIVATVRFDVKVQHEPAAVKGINVTTS